MAVTTWVWINGEIVRGEDARISALDHGITVGDGVFETMKIVGTTPFAMRRHLERLRHSASVIGLNVGWTDSQLRQICDETIAAASGEEPPGRIRITITGGPGPLGSDRGDVEPTLIVAVSPSSPWPLCTDVATVAWTRNERSAIAGAKTTSYGENVVALAHAHKLGASEAIMANTQGVLCEGTGSNIFFEVDGKLATPALSTGCLAGVTRALVCESVEVDERDDLTFEHLLNTTEAFLTSSTRNVHPISHVNSTRLVWLNGPFTQGAADALRDIEAERLDP